MDAHGDFLRTGNRIKDRLGIDQAYDPTADAAVEGKVDALLAGGLSADEAVTVALLNNRSFQSLFQSIGVARADVVQSGLWTNPSLLIGTRFIEGGGRSELTFGLAQQLVDLWQIPVRKRIAEAQLAHTVLGVLDEAVRIATSTRALYYDCLWRQQIDLIARDNVELSRRSLRLATARLDAGETSPLDAGLVRTQVLQAESAAMIARRDLKNVHLALAQALGLARYDQPLQLTDRFASPELGVAANDVLIETATQNRFDVQMVDAQIDAAAEDVDLQILKIWPNVTIGLNGERTEKRTMPSRKILADTARASIGAGQLTAPMIQSRGQRNLARSQFIDALLGPSIQLTLPIWDQNQAQIAKAGMVYRQRIKDREFMLDAIVTQIRQASNNAKTATEQYALFESDVLPQGESNIKTAQSRYENGEDSILILLEAQDAMFVQKRQAADALRELLVTRAELARVCGGKLPGNDANATRSVNRSDGLNAKNDPGVFDSTREISTGMDD